MGLELIELVPIFMVFILYFLGMPIVYALFGSTFFYFTFIDTTSKNWLILQKVMTSTQSFSMLAIPFFVMAGSVMNYGGISDKMMDFAEVLTGHMKGGLAQVNVVLSMLMGGCSGSANADCAMQSKMLVPEMEKRGYSKAFSAAITAASSAATPVIPPGVNLIVFTLIAQISLGRTFAAGYIPGILMAISMMIVVSIIAHKRNYPTTREKFPALKEIVKQGITSFWGLFFPFGIILGMRFGMFTPSEGGAGSRSLLYYYRTFRLQETVPERASGSDPARQYRRYFQRCSDHGCSECIRLLHDLDQPAESRGNCYVKPDNQQVAVPHGM